MSTGLRFFAALVAAAILGAAATLLLARPAPAFAAASDHPWNNIGGYRTWLDSTDIEGPVVLLSAQSAQITIGHGSPSLTVNALHASNPQGALGNPLIIQKGVKVRIVIARNGLGYVSGYIP